jgi:hypothetical protein
MYITLAEFKAYLKTNDSDTFTADATANTITLATPGKVAWATGNAVTVSNTGGALPAPLAAGVVYFLVAQSGNAQIWKLATTVAKAQANDTIDLTGAGTGVQTVQTAVTDDALLTQAVVNAQSTFESATGRKFEADEDTIRYLDAPLCGPQLLLDADLCAITTITNGDGEELAAGTDYVTEPRNDPPYYAIRLTYGGGKAWTWDTTPEGAISIEGKWAYSVTPPADVREAVFQLAAWLYRRQQSSDQADRVTISPDGSRVVPSGVPAFVKDTIESYTPLAVGGTGNAW